MVNGDHFKSACTLTEMMKNLYVVRVGRKTNNKRCGPRLDCQSSLAPPRLGTGLAELYWGCLVPRHVWDESRFQLYPVDGGMRVRRLPGEHSQQNCHAARVQARGGYVHVGGAQSLFVLPERYVNGVVYRDVLLDTMVPFARRSFTLPRWQCYASSFQGSDWLSAARGHHWNGPACTPPWLQTHRASVGRIEAYNQQNGLSAPHTHTHNITSMNFPRPCWISWPISLWNTISD